MKKEVIEKLKKCLLRLKSSLEEELKKFAEKDSEIKGDWDTKFPQFTEGSSGSQQLEESADEVAEYANRLPVEHNLEIRLNNINLALEKIKKGQYGNCEKCGKKISEERLEIYPEARLCKECQK